MTNTLTSVRRVGPRANQVGGFAGSDPRLPLVALRVS
jgi:hypothetical protein